MQDRKQRQAERIARSPRWSADKDSGLTVGDILAVEAAQRETVIRSAGPAVIVVLEADCAPRLEFTAMTSREIAAWSAHHQNDVRTQIVMEALQDIEALNPTQEES